MTSGASWGMNPDWTVHVILLRPWEARVGYSGVVNCGVGVPTRTFPGPELGLEDGRGEWCCRGTLIF